MSLLDTLIGIFSDQETNEAFQENPEGFLNQNGFGNVTSQDIEAEMPRVLESLQGNSGGATQG
ncbi:MAG: IniB N-terminal domain-containing protein, partial [Acidimicrobiales bacterium]